MRRQRYATTVALRALNQLWLHSISVNLFNRNDDLFERTGSQKWHYPFLARNNLTYQPGCQQIWAFLSQSQQANWFKQRSVIRLFLLWTVNHCCCLTHLKSSHRDLGSFASELNWNANDSIEFKIREGLWVDMNHTLQKIIPYFETDWVFPESRAHKWLNLIDRFVCAALCSSHLKILTCERAELKSLPLRLSISDWIAVSVLVCAASDMHTSSWPSFPVSASFRQLSRMLSSSDMLVTLETKARGTSWPCVSQWTYTGSTHTHTHRLFTAAADPITQYEKLFHFIKNFNIIKTPPGRRSESHWPHMHPAALEVKKETLNLK